MRYSYSSLSLLAKCEAQWAYKYLRNLRPLEDSSGPQTAGHLLHALVAADALGRGRDGGSLLVVPEHLDVCDGLTVDLSTISWGAADLLLWIESQWTRYAREDATAPLAAGAAEALGCADPAGVPGALRAWWARYARRWAAADADLEPLLVEAKWIRQLPGTEIELTGRVDLVYRDRTRGLIVVGDHKFSGGWNHDPDSLLDLQAYQLHLGAWGLAPLLAEHGVAAPRAVAYNRGLYPAPATPELTKGTRDKTTGGWKTPPRLSKSTTRYDLMTYLAWCESPAAQVVEGGEVIYRYAPEPEVVEKLRAAEMSEDWFRRKLAMVNVRVIERHAAAALAQARRAQTLDFYTAMPSPGPGCTYCDFKHLCRAETYGGILDELNPGDYGLRFSSRGSR